MYAKPIVLKSDFHLLRGSAALHKFEAAQIGGQCDTAGAVGSRRGEVCIRAIAQSFKFFDELGFVDALACIDFQRLGKNLGRH